MRQLLLLTPLLLLVACGDEAEPGFTLFSEAIVAGQPIPARHTCDGDPVPDISPPLAWLRAPALARSFALIVDTRSGEFQDDPQVLWVVFDIPPELEGLEENVGKQRNDLPDGARPGRNYNGATSYIGPCPPSGEEFSYRFWLYALDTTGLTGAWTDPTAVQLREAIKGHVLDTAKLEATYAH